MGKKRGFKRPSHKSSKRFQIKAEEPTVSYNSRKPIFSLKYMPYLQDYCISRCERGKKSLILDKILKLSQSTWSEIRSLRMRSGFEIMPRHRFSISLPSVLTPEVQILVARYDGDGGRLAGFRDKDVFHIVLAGKDLYPH